MRPVAPEYLPWGHLAHDGGVVVSVDADDAA